METLIVVKAGYDAEAGVWFVESSDIEGLHLEGATLEALVERIPNALADLLAEAGMTAEVPVEVVAHARTRVPAAA